VGDDAGRGGARFYRKVALGTVLPGAGLLRTSWRPLGIGLLVAFAAGAVYVGYRVWSGGGFVDAGLDLAVNPEALRVVSAVVAVAVVLWIGSIVLTAELARPRPPREGGVWRGVFAASACLAVLLPGGLVVRYLDVQADLVGEVFAASSTTLGQSARVEARPRTAIPTPAADPWADIPRVNLVLLGSDAGRDRTGVRTDSMMVVSINTETGDTLLVGVPRNLENVPFPKSNPLHDLYPDGYNCGDECLMNGIWTLAEDRSDLFPDDPNPGRRTTIDVLGAVTGLDLENSVVIDLSGFRQLVDAMGGVDINVTEKVCIECHITAWGTFEWTSDAHEWLEPGPQHLDGRQALWYARSRATSDDFSRMRRQRCVAGALLEQADPVNMLARYPKIAKAVKDNVSSDIPPDELPAWVDLVERVQEGGSIRSLPLTSNVINPANPNYAKIHKLVKKALKPPKTKATPTPSSSGSSTPTPTKTTEAFPTSDPTDGQPLAATC
jgi:LCP family protein required for cell wall assembly